MANLNDGGPAYACASESSIFQEGMSVRAKFAGQMMAAMIAATPADTLLYAPDQITTAKLAVQYADALILALNL